MSKEQVDMKINHQNPQKWHILILKFKTCQMGLTMDYSRDSVNYNKEMYNPKR